MDKECYQAICYNGHQRTVTLEYANLNDDLGFCNATNGRSKILRQMRKTI